MNLKKIMLELNLKKKRGEPDIVNITLISVFVGLVIIYINFTYFSQHPQAFTSLNASAIIIALGIPLMYRYENFGKIKKVEAIFPRFMSDVTENINAGMTLPQAIRSATSNDYGDLTPYVKRISAKISWGIPFETVLTSFADEVKSPSLRRTVQTIIEAHRSGGSLGTVLRAVSSSIQEVEKIKKERSASVYSQMLNGYIIFIIFLFVMLGLSSFMGPTFKTSTIAQQADIETLFTSLFRNLIMIQGFFAGLAVGKMSEGSLIAGLKHSFVLALVGYTAFFFFG